MRILFFGQRPIGSAPALATAQAVEAHGHQAVFEEPLSDSTGEWVELICSADVAVCTFYGKWSKRTLRILTQTKIAAALGTPVVRWWVGSDVWNAMRDGLMLEDAKVLDQYVAANVAVCPRLKDELAKMGIQSTVILRPLADMPTPIDVPWDERLAHSVLVYLPAGRAAFCGASILDALIPARPDLTFYLVADDGQRYKECSNVVSLGWVEDMEAVYHQVGCLLRITEHDGYPRMVREALSRGKYVVWSWPFEGCILARQPDEVNAALSSVVASKTANHQGIKVMKRLNRPQVFRQEFTALVRHVRARRWLKAATGLAGVLPEMYRACRQRSSLLPDL